MKQSELKTDGVKWYQVPVLWLALLIFACMIAGCIHLIIVSQDINSSPIVLEGEKYILGVPTHKSAKTAGVQK